MEEEMKAGISAQLYQLIYVCGQYACTTPLVVCAKVSVCLVSFVFWQKLWRVGLSFALHYAHLTVPNCAHIKNLTLLSNRKMTLKDT